MAYGQKSITSSIIGVIEYVFKISERGWIQQQRIV